MSCASWSRARATTSRSPFLPTISLAPIGITRTRTAAADVQIASGALGALIIEGDFADVPEIAAAQERLLVVTEAVFDSFGTVEDFGTLFPETAARFFAVNGVREPTITMRPGEVQRWRILHAGWQDDIFMELEGHTLNPIARDGIPLARMGLSVPRKPDQPTDYPNAMLMAPGQRIDVLVQAGEPGTYAFRAVPYDQGYDVTDRTNRPPRGGRRSAADEPPRQTASSAGEAHPR